MLAGSSVGFTALHAALNAAGHGAQHLHFGMFGALAAFVFMRELSTQDNPASAAPITYVADPADAKPSHDATSEERLP